MVSAVEAGLPPVGTALWGRISGLAEGLCAPGAIDGPLVVLGGNYRHVFACIEEQLQQAGVRVVVSPGAFTSMPEQVASSVPADMAATVLKVGGAAAAFASGGLVAVVGAVAALLGEVADGAALATEAWRAHQHSETPELSWGELLRRSVNQLTLEQPLVLCIGGFDAGSEDSKNAWRLIVYRLGELSSKHPVLVIAGMDAHPAVESESPVVAQFPLLAGHEVAIETGRIVVERIDALTVMAVKRWLGPIDTAAGEAVVSMAGGDSFQAYGTVRLWSDDGFLVRDLQGRITLSSDTGTSSGAGSVANDTVTQRVDSEYWELARKALTIASVQGRTFSGTAAAHAAASTSGHAPEVVEDLFDDLCPHADRPWLLDTVSHHSTTDRTGLTFTHWKYRFASEAIWWHYRTQLQLDDRYSLNHAGVSTLKAAQATHGLSAHFADELGDAARVAGQPELALALRGHSDVAAKMRYLISAVAVGLAAPTDPPDPALANDLNDLSMKLVNFGAPRLAVAATTRAIELAQSLNARGILATGIGIRGVAHGRLGNYTAAIEHHRIEIGHKQILFDGDPSPTHRRELAVGHGRLGAALYGRGDHDEAIEHHRIEIGHKQILFDGDPSPTHRRDLAIGHGRLGAALNGRGDHDEAIEHHRVEALLLMSDSRNS